MHDAHAVVLTLSILHRTLSLRSFGRLRWPIPLSVICGPLELDISAVTRPVLRAWGINFVPMTSTWPSWPPQDALPCMKCLAWL
ncbi:hypothetical protein K469DRAFT_346550 [Zopfia rhizophila CBS 207.26]|uniref:Secreted protein n=1 Tax=Zopfia rhizophila CBS 207.26 TaxID=1314779 RepID=A0A6A6ELV0_9PEZI|nr:hypothetical protein K469DRAFT_346550 [Zopfia rhizophila CBS 207.26]